MMWIENFSMIVAPNGESNRGINSFILQNDLLKSHELNNFQEKIELLDLFSLWKLKRSFKLDNLKLTKFFFGLSQLTLHFFFFFVPSLGDLGSWAPVASNVSEKEKPTDILGANLDPRWQVFKTINAFKCSNFLIGPFS